MELYAGMDPTDEKRGDFMMTLTPEQWEKIKPEMQFITESTVAAKIYMFTVLVAEHPASHSLREFRKYLRGVSDWDRPGVLVLRLVLEEDGKTRGDFELFLPLFPTLEESAGAELIEHIGYWTIHRN